MRRSIDDETGGVSPYVGTRVTHRQHDLLKDIASQRGCSMSDLMRDALERHLAELEATGPPGQKAT